MSAEGTGCEPEQSFAWVQPPRVASPSRVFDQNVASSHMPDLALGLGGPPAQMVASPPNDATGAMTAVAPSQSTLDVLRNPKGNLEQPALGSTQLPLSAVVAGASSGADGPSLLATAKSPLLETPIFPFGSNDEAQLQYPALQVRILPRTTDHAVAQAPQTFRPARSVSEKVPTQSRSSNPPVTQKNVLDTLSSALDDTRNRAFIVKLHKELDAFMHDSTRSVHTFGSAEHTSFHRFLVHQVGEACGLQHPTIHTPSGRAIQWSKPEGEVDPSRIGWVAAFGGVVSAALAKPSHQSDPSKGKVKIMKRHGADGSSRRPGKDAAYVQVAAQGDDSRQKSLEEREEEYRIARARIFEGDTTADLIPSYPTPMKATRPRPPVHHSGLFLGDCGPWMPSVRGGQGWSTGASVYPGGNVQWRGGEPADAHAWSSGQSSSYGSGAWENVKPDRTHAWSTVDPTPSSGGRSEWQGPDGGGYLPPHRPHGVRQSPYQAPMMVFTPGVDGESQWVSQDPMALGHGHPSRVPPSADGGGIMYNGGSYFRPQTVRGIPTGVPNGAGPNHLGEGSEIQPHSDPPIPHKP